MPNALTDAVSPYLRSHAGNPVDWWQWGPEPFAEAARRDVPVLVSIGYSTCHWCHVMARESFSDPEIAAIMNEQVRRHQGRPRRARRGRLHLPGGRCRVHRQPRLAAQRVRDAARAGPSSPERTGRRNPCRGIHRSGSCSMRSAMPGATGAPRSSRTARRSWMPCPAFRSVAARSWSTSGRSSPSSRATRTPSLAALGQPRSSP